MTLLKGHEVSDDTISCVPCRKGWDFQDSLHVLRKKLHSHDKVKNGKHSNNRLFWNLMSSKRFFFCLLWISFLPQPTMLHKVVDV